MEALHGLPPCPRSPCVGAQHLSPPTPRPALGGLSYRGLRAEPQRQLYAPTEAGRARITLPGPSRLSQPVTRKMAAPIGNRFWEARSTHGRPATFESPDALWENCVEYFEWVEANPLHEMKAFMFQGAVVTEAMPKMRAMTLNGLCNFLGIAVQTWHNYRARDGFLEVTTRVDQIMRQQKFEGAAAELLNPNIIARDLGLAEKSELTGKDGGPIKSEVDVSAKDLIASRIAGIASRGAAKRDTE